MNMNTKKKEYIKPSVKLVEWNFSEAVCNTVTTTSTKCLNVTTGGSTLVFDKRTSPTDSGNTWNRVGSR